jgi:uncharacterized protein
MIAKGVKAGGKTPMKDQDYGWMYSRVINDLDGHHWEFFWMDAKKAPKN